MRNLHLLHVRSSIIDSNGLHQKTPTEREREKDFVPGDSLDFTLIDSSLPEAAEAHTKPKCHLGKHHKSIQEI